MNFFFCNLIFRSILDVFFAFVNNFFYISIFVFSDLNYNIHVDVCKQDRFCKVENNELFYFEGIKNTFNIWQPCSGLEL